MKEDIGILILQELINSLNAADVDFRTRKEIYGSLVDVLTDKGYAFLLEECVGEDKAFDDLVSPEETIDDIFEDDNYDEAEEDGLDGY